MTEAKMVGWHHATRYRDRRPLLGRMTEARMLAQEIYTDSANLGLGQISMLAHLAVNAGFANDLDGQLRLHARLMNALDALSTALEDFPAGGVA